MTEHPVKAKSSGDLELLFIECARLYYSGQTRTGLELAANGVAGARAIGDRAALRKMLTAYGIFQSDLHNLPEAFQTFSEALDLGLELGEPQYVSSVWQNISSALAYAELPELSISAARVAGRYAEQISTSDGRRIPCAAALSNIAYGCLFSRQYSLGLRSAKLACDLLRCPADFPPSEGDKIIAQGALARSYQARLLLRVNMHEAAAKCVADAEDLLRHAPSTNRVSLVVQMTRALLDTYSGNFAHGVSRLTDFLTSTITQNPVLIADALRDLVEAHTSAKLEKPAAEYLRQLGRHMQQIRSEHTLFHHHRHTGWLASINKGGAGSSGRVETRPRVTRRQRAFSNERSEVLEDLCSAAELHDDSSGMHACRVAALARALALRIGLGEMLANSIAQAAKLHDVGKVGVPPTILRKPASLDPAEMEIMRSHTVAGADLLASAEIDTSGIAVAVARHHHEWWSGAGYPDGLAREEIPIAARITSLAESFDAMTHDRAYRPRLSVTSALEVISDRAGRQFDPVLAMTFCSLVRDLQATHRELDPYLERGAKSSRFLRAKQRFADQLAGLAS
jgi:putative two-component system response regulator